MQNLDATGFVNKIPKTSMCDDYAKRNLIPNSRSKIFCLIIFFFVWVRRFYGCHMFVCDLSCFLNLGLISGAV